MLNRIPLDWREEGVPMQITVVGPADLPELLPLLRALLRLLPGCTRGPGSARAVAGAARRPAAGRAAAAGPRRHRPGCGLRHPVLDLADAGRRPRRGDE